MYSLSFPWKEFKVHLPDIELWFKGNAGNIYLGNLAEESSLTLLFKEKPSETVELNFQGYWQSLTEAGELSKIELAKKIVQAEHKACQNLLHINLNDMIVAERKIFMGLPLTQEDRIALLQKYPE
jgi:hypothetical protein